VPPRPVPSSRATAASLTTKAPDVDRQLADRPRVDQLDRGGSACLGKTLGRRRRDDTDADNAFDEAADGVGAGVSLENGYASTISVSKLVMEPTTSPRSGSDTSNVSRIGVAGQLNA